MFKALYFHKVSSTKSINTKTAIKIINNFDSFQTFNTQPDQINLKSDSLSVFTIITICRDILPLRFLLQIYSTLCFHVNHPKQTFMYSFNTEIITCHIHINSMFSLHPTLLLYHQIVRIKPH